jgi:hypothetical protein
MRFLCRLIALLALLALGSHSRPVHAGTLSVGTPAWSKRTSPLNNQINRADCLAGSTITFSTQFSSDASGDFQVWSGVNCTDVKNRTDNVSCVLVKDGSTDDETVTVNVQELVKGYKDTAAATADTCNNSTEEGLQKRSLFFLVINTGSQEVDTQGTAWPYEYDVVAPKPPTNVTASGGENSLIVDLTAPSEDVDHYRFYCSPVDGADAGATDCSSSKLVPNMEAEDMFYCGDVGAKALSSAETDAELVNGVTYAVAVASQDNVGNIGVLSTIACGVPQEVTGYFEAYRLAGGQAGGGFCSFRPARRGAVPLALGLLLGLAVFARRRR